MTDVNKSVGVVTSDPAVDAPVGTTIAFSSANVFTHQPHGETALDNLGYFDTILLHVQIVLPNSVLVHGSAVLVSVGVAFTAKHILEEHLDQIMSGKASLYCISMSNNVLIWKCLTISWTGYGTDVAILTLSLRSALPETGFKIAKLTTRTPKIGEQVTLVGFRAADDAFLRGETSTTISGQVLASKGLVSARYPQGRDKIMIPGPAFAVEAKTSGGMSGGPVFDDNGYLIGIISVGLSLGDNNGQTYVSHFWPALLTAIHPKWPSGLFDRPKPLRDFGELCQIDRIEAVQPIGDKHFTYAFWE